ncbi:MAG TPA: tetratricopeptide repeat protein [Opitutaceae bacterium]|nr:tetratricopeptide repeat protein [Opitutaceae bacterium]
MNVATDPARDHLAAARPPRRGWVVAALLTVAVFAAYANTLRAPFVYDDILAIPDNPSIRRLWPLTAVLGPQPEGGLTVSGRPILNLSFALNYAVSGAEPWSYHVFNICIHAGAALLLFGLVHRAIRHHASGQETALAAIIAALWALHPLQTQAVTYTVQRAESLMGFFYLLTLYAFVRGAACHPLDAKNRGRARRWWALSAMACALGMGTKEVMVTAPLIVLLYDRTFLAGSFASAWRARRGVYLLLGSTWFVLAALVLSTGGNRGGTVGAGVGIPLWAYPLTQFQAVARYLMLSVWPRPLVFEYGTFWVRAAADVVPYALVVLPLLGATAWALWKKPVLGFLGAWFFGILGPTSLAPGTIQMIVEHRMYLPFAAVATLVVVGLQRWLAPRVALALGVALAIALLALTVARNRTYRSAVDLWRATVASRPENPRAHDGLADALAAAGRIDEAIRHREEAVRLLPDEAHYHYNLALTLASAGRVPEAIRHYSFSLKLVPTEAKTHNNLAVLLVQNGRPAEALHHYAEAVRLQPKNALYHYNQGIARARAGNWAEAATSYEQALRLQPAHADAHVNLGTALMKLGRADEAVSHYVEAVRLSPADADIGINFGGALLVARRPAEALAQFRAVLARHPDSLEAHYGLGNAFAALRQSDAAIASYEAVLRRAPNHANAHARLGDALLTAGQIARAALQYERAASLLPDDAEVHQNLGVAYALLERWSDARREFETALRLKPDYPEASRNLEQLKRLLGG